MKKRTCKGWWLMVLFMWDALFRRKYDYGKWDQDNTPSYPHKREDTIHRGD